MKRSRNRTFKGRTWVALGSMSLVTSFLFAACGGSDETSKDNKGTGGNGDEAGIGPAGNGGTSGVSGTTGQGGSSNGGASTGGKAATGGNSGVAGTGMSGTGGGGTTVCLESGDACTSGPDCCSFSC